MVLFLLACPSGGDSNTGALYESRPLGVANLEVSDCSTDTATPETTLSLSAMGDGKILVAHLAYPAECCLGFAVTAWADPLTQTIPVSYEPVGDPCDCMCSYDLGYRLEDVPAGDWTVNAAGTTAEVHVE